MKHFIDRYFYKLLKEDKIENELWNTPSNEVWLKISQKLQQDDKKQKTAIWWWVWCAILLLSFGFCLNFYYNLKLKKELVKYNESLVTVDRKTVVELDTTSTKSLLQKNKTRDAKAGVSFNKSVEKILPNHKELVYRPFDNESLSIKKNIRKYHKNNREESLAVSSTNMQNNLIVNISKPLNRSTDLAFLTNLIPSFVIRQSEEDSLPDIVYSEIINQNSERNYGSLMVFYSPSWTYAKSSIDPVGSYATMRTNKALSAGCFGLGYYYPLGHRFFLRSGLQYRSVQLWSESILKSPYDMDKSFVNSKGQIQSQLSLNIPSSVGMLKTEMQIEHETGLDINDGESINIEMELVQQVNYLTIPVGIAYTYPLTTKIRLLSEVGIFYNRLLSNRYNINAFLQYKDQQMGFMSANYDNLKLNNHFDYFINLSVERILSERFSIPVGLNYTHSMQNISAQKDMKAGLQEFGLYIGLKYKI